MNLISIQPKRLSYRPIAPHLFFKTILITLRYHINNTYNSAWGAASTVTSSARTTETKNHRQTQRTRQNMSHSFISGQPSVQGEDGAQNTNEQQQPTDLQEYSWNLIKVSTTNHLLLAAIETQLVMFTSKSLSICYVRTNHWNWFYVDGFEPALVSATFDA